MSILAYPSMVADPSMVAYPPFPFTEERFTPRGGSASLV